MTERSSYHHGDLRRALVDAAVELAQEATPEEVTLREVARRVGVNHRAAYRHFEDKAALLAAVAEEGYRTLLARLEEVLAEEPGTLERLNQLAVAYTAFALDNPARYRIMFGRRLNEDGRFPVLEELVERAYELLKAEFVRGQQEGLVAPGSSRELVFAFWSFLHGFSSLAIVRRLKVKRALLPGYTQALFSALREGFRARPPSGTRRRRPSAR